MLITGQRLWRIDPLEQSSLGLHACSELSYTLSLRVYHSPQTTCLHSALSYDAISVFLRLCLKSAFHISCSISLIRVFFLVTCDVTQLWRHQAIKRVNHNRGVFIRVSIGKESDKIDQESPEL